MTNTNTTPATLQTLLRYVLTAMGENVAMMPATAKVVYLQPHKKGVEVYALLTGPEVEPEPRRFYVAKTGETLAEMATYLGTATFPTMKARHVFELA